MHMRRWPRAWPFDTTWPGAPSENRCLLAGRCIRSLHEQGCLGGTPLPGSPSFVNMFKAGVFAVEY
eukprot:1187674-Prorocentrum_minimum.AAC.4